MQVSTGPSFFLKGNARWQHPINHPSHQTTTTKSTPSSPSSLWRTWEELAHEWGSFACALAFITSPASAHVFQAIGMAFLALSHEESAYAHYFLLGNRLRYPPSTIAEGLELHEAFVDWTAVGMWLERLVNDGHTGPHLLDTVRPLVMQARAHQRRLWSLLMSVQEEHARLTKQDVARKEGARS